MLEGESRERRKGFRVISLDDIPTPSRLQHSGFRHSQSAPYFTLSDGRGLFAESNCTCNHEQELVGL